MTQMKAPVGATWYSSATNSIKFALSGFTALLPHFAEYSRKPVSSAGYGSYTARFLQAHSDGKPAPSTVYSYVDVKFVAAPGCTQTIANSLYADMKNSISTGTVANGLAAETFITQQLPGMTDINV